MTGRLQTRVLSTASHRLTLDLLKLVAELDVCFLLLSFSANNELQKEREREVGRYRIKGLFVDLESWVYCHRRVRLFVCVVCLFVSLCVCVFVCLCVCLIV